MKPQSPIKLIVTLVPLAKKDAEDGEFPHASTADIFYDVSQLASYTALGYDLGRELLRGMQIEDLEYFEEK